MTAMRANRDIGSPHGLIPLKSGIAPLPRIGRRSPTACSPTLTRYRREHVGDGHILRVERNANKVSHVEPGADDRAVIDALQRRLAPYGGRQVIGRADQTSHAMLDNEIKQQRVIGTVLPSIFLGVAAFLLNVVVSRLVATQREQIAALKALGYANPAIAAHYLKMVLASMALGYGLVHLIAGAGAVVLVALLGWAFAPRPVEVEVARPRRWRSIVRACSWRYRRRRKGWTRPTRPNTVVDGVKIKRRAV